jgi:hypothetical protein
MGNINPVLFGILAIIGVSAMTFYYISHVGGWASLAERYRMTEPFSGRQWKFQCGQMRYWTQYNNCLIVGADPRGLYLSILWPLRLAHPPLFVPWREISRTSKKFLWVQYVELRLGSESTIPFRISYTLAQKLKEAAGASWPIEAKA